MAAKSKDGRQRSIEWERERGFHLSTPMDQMSAMPFELAANCVPQKEGRIAIANK
jgi:hypothetical protein